MINPIKQYERQTDQPSYNHEHETFCSVDIDTILSYDCSKEDAEMAVLAQDIVRYRRCLPYNIVKISYQYCRASCANKGIIFDVLVLRLYNYEYWLSALDLPLHQIDWGGGSLDAEFVIGNNCQNL
ncbi:hypothetical protein AVEN_173869-1 [Araneus ventricosus]|uniref:Uncharacterized protein n=1 Tax=Araneus ventricosus TaxID=182803 RepID=A0A4Y2I165_ARAVE|nr:hypothetical protein AVEN_173869-1 [Araneus ventricosus]